MGISKNSLHCWLSLLLATSRRPALGLLLAVFFAQWLPWRVRLAPMPVQTNNRTQLISRHSTVAFCFSPRKDLRRVTIFLAPLVRISMILSRNVSMKSKLISSPGAFDPLRTLGNILRSILFSICSRYLYVWRYDEIRLCIPRAVSRETQGEPEKVSSSKATSAGFTYAGRWEMYLAADSNFYLVPVAVCNKRSRSGSGNQALSG